MSEQTVKCPICGSPYKVYMYYTGDQSACQRCRLEERNNDLIDQVKFAITGIMENRNA